MQQKSLFTPFIFLNEYTVQYIKWIDNFPAKIRWASITWAFDILCKWYVDVIWFCWLFNCAFKNSKAVTQAAYDPNM